jgi:predicted small lipoprotein YifL
MRNTLLLLLVAVCFTAGCGQKGPLYLPTDKPPVKTRAKPPAAQPSADSDQKRQTQ